MGNCIGNVDDVEIPRPQPNVDILTNEAIYQYCTDKNTPYVSYQNIQKKVKVLRVIDGDTVDMAMVNDLTKQIFKYRVRLYGIDTPEKKPLKSNPDREKEIESAKASSEAMKKKMEENNHLVTVLLHKPDKYGRLLGIFYDKQGNDINQWMIDQGFATAYFGKTKKSFAEVHNSEDIYHVDEIAVEE
jgi:micrococcal nuclease